MIVFILIAFAFLPLSTYLLNTKSLLFSASISFLLGCFAVTYSSFLLHLFGIPMTVYLHLSVIALFATANYFFWGKNLKKVLTSRGVYFPNDLFYIEKTMLFASIFMFLILLIYSIYWPVRDWDALTLYDFRAKVIATQHSVDLLKSLEANYYFAYPLFTSQVHALHYQFNDLSPMFFYAALFTSFSIAFYYLIRMHTTRFISLLLFFILITTNILVQHSFMAYTNLPYAVYLVLGIFFSFNYFLYNKTGYLYVSLLSVGASIWVRDAEPFWVIVLLSLCIASLYHASWKKIGLILLVFAFFILPWQVYRHMVFVDKVFISSTVSFSNGISQITYVHLYTLLRYLWTYFFSPYLLMHIIFFMQGGVVIFFTKNKNSIFLMSLVLTIYLLILAGTTYMSITYPKWQKVGGSLERMSLLLIPAILYFVAYSTPLQKRK